MSTTKKKIAIVAFEQPGSDQTLFYRLWKLAASLHAPLTREDPDDDRNLAAVRIAIEQHAAQMGRQKVHVDDIKRLCHVPIT